MFTSSDWFSSDGSTITLGKAIKSALRSLKKPPKNGTTLHSGISNDRLRASLYSLVICLDSRAADRKWRVDKSSSDMDNQKGFSFSDLKKKKKYFEVKRCEWVIVVSNFSKSCILMRWCLFGTRPTRLGGFLYQIMLWLLIKCTFAQQELTNFLKLKFGVKYFQLETYLNPNVLNIWLTWDQPLSPWLY